MVAPAMYLESVNYDYGLAGKWRHLGLFGPQVFRDPGILAPAVCMESFTGLVKVSFPTEAMKAQ